MKPGGGWFLRPVGIAIAVLAALAAAVLFMQGDLIRGVVAIGLHFLGIRLFLWSRDRDRHWRTAASRDAVDTERGWRIALSDSVENTPANEIRHRSPAWRDLAAQARDLRDDQIERLLREARFEFKRFRTTTWADGFVRGAESDNAGRAARARETATAAARSTIDTEGRLAECATLLENVREAVGSAMSRRPDEAADIGDVVRAVAESAALALAAGSSITRDQHAALYGPWWRAVIADTEPIWFARWSTVTLAGFWLTAAGCVLAAILNQGDAGYISLGFIAAGVVGFAAGGIHGATHSIPWPEPVSHLVDAHGSASGPGYLSRIWRAPERLISRLAAVFRSAGLT